MEETISQPVQLTEPSEPSAEQLRKEAESLLNEARNTKAVLDGFAGAIRGGRFDGGAMLDLAKGLAFLDAIRQQNLAHIKNLQERLEVKK